MRVNTFLNRMCDTHCSSSWYSMKSSLSERYTPRSKGSRTLLEALSYLFKAAPSQQERQAETNITGRIFNPTRACLPGMR